MRDEIRKEEVGNSGGSGVRGESLARDEDSAALQLGGYVGGEIDQHYGVATVRVTDDQPCAAQSPLAIEAHPELNCLSRPITGDPTDHLLDLHQVERCVCRDREDSEGDEGGGEYQEPSSHAGSLFARFGPTLESGLEPAQLD